MRSFSIGSLAAVILWFCGTSAAILWVSIDTQRDFDPLMRLSEAIMSLSFEHKLVAALPGATISAPVEHASKTTLPTIYHITQGDCLCEFLASSHKATLNQWSSKEGFTNIALDINEHPQLAQFIPSTPAVLVVDANSELMYLGPYSRGMGCFASSGQIDDYLADWLRRPAGDANAQNSVIDVDASGCYCAT